MRTGWADALLASAVLAGLLATACARPGLAASALPQQTPEPAPADTFADGLARELVTQSVLRRPSVDYLQALSIGTVSRLRVGFELPDQFLWRDRNFYRREQSGTITALGTDSVALQVTARSRGSPVLGDATVGLDAPVGLDPEDERLLGMVDLGLEDIADEVVFHPTTGEIHMLGSQFLDPLGRHGRSAYRFATGDTIRVALPDSMTLIGIEVTPRPGLDAPLTGVLWFDIGTQRLVRMVVQPEGRWELNAGLQGFLRRVPLIRANALGEVDFLSIDYGPSPDGPVVPLRALLRGRAFWLSGLYEMPIDVEWTARWDESDEVVDPVAELPPPLTAGWDFGVPRSELNPFLRQLDGILPTAPPPTLRDAALATLGSVRFNRVQGLSAAARYPYPISPRSTLAGEIRLGTTAFQPTGSVSLQHRLRPVWWLAEAYSRLEDANRWETTLGFWNSWEALLFGEDDGNYYVAQGVGASVGGENRPLSWTMGGFFERHDDAPTHTDFSLFGSDEDDTTGRPNIDADEGDVYGVRGRAQLQWGDDAQKRVVILRGTGEIAWGDFQYRDLELQLDLVSRLFGPLAGAMRVAGGRVKADGETPTQRLFYLGGRKTVRGFEGNSARGESYFLLKGELGTRVPALRFVVFSDVGWAGDYSNVFEDEPLASVGIAVSFLDGVLRADFAWPVRSRGNRRLHIYSSGLF